MEESKQDRIAIVRAQLRERIVEQRLGCPPFSPAR
jgi:hypothetical protein